MFGKHASAMMIHKKLMTNTVLYNIAELEVDESVFCLFSIVV